MNREDAVLIIKRHFWDKGFQPPKDLDNSVKHPDEEVLDWADRIRMSQKAKAEVENG